MLRNLWQTSFSHNFAHHRLSHRPLKPLLCPYPPPQATAVVVPLDPLTPAYHCAQHPIS